LDSALFTTLVGEDDTHVRGRRLKGADRRDEILNAASALYITFGPSKTTTRQIAEAVGISQPSLYAHFPTKEALSHALAARAFSFLEARMNRVERLSLSPHERLSALITGYIAFALEESAAYKIAFMLDLALDPEQIKTLQQDTGLRSFHIFAQKIGELQSEKFVRAGPTDVVAQSIWAAMHGLCALLLARPQFPWATLDKLIAFHTQMIIQGAKSENYPAAAGCTSRDAE
jgi:AcrR family transcriptional regulator